MKRKHFILALVAMLMCVSFSAYAGDVIVVNSWAELKAALEANDGVQRSAARQRSTAMRTVSTASESTTEAVTKTPIPKTPYYYEDFQTTMIQLGKDVVYDDALPISKSSGTTLDLNGHTVSGSESAEHSYPFYNYGMFLVVDNSEAGTGAIYCGVQTGIKDDGVSINEEAVFVMTGGNIICTHDSEDDAAVVNYGIAYITGGTIEGANNAVLNKDGATMNVLNGALITGDVVGTGIEAGSGVYAVAQIGTAKYGTLQAAINAAKEGETVQLLAGTIEESTITLPATLKNVTIQGAENAVLKNTLVTTPALGNTSGATINYDGVTFNGVAFDNSRIYLPGWANDALNQSVSVKNLAITNCTFENIVATSNIAAVNLNMAQSELVENFTFTGNTINSITGGESSGVIALVKGDVTITGNTIKNVSGNAINVQFADAKVTISDNTLENWGTSGAGRAIRSVVIDANNASLTATENVMIHTDAPEEFAKVTGTDVAKVVNLNGNYWSGNNPIAEGILSVENEIVDSYYADAALNTLLHNKVGGSIVGYTDTNRIWGEAWGNASYTFVVKVYGKDGTEIGSTSLKESTELIDGDVSVSWQIKLNGTSSSWDMVWAEGAPSIKNMPAKVELWIDGEKVSEGEIKLNSPDNLTTYNAAVIDTDGKILSYHPALADAVAAGNNVAILTEGTYSVPTGKDLTITGAVGGVVFDNIDACNMGGANVTFNNVTFDYYPNKNYTGLQHSGNLVYNNCTINGQVFLYGQSETFNKCTFNQNSADAYNVWTYGAKEVAFNECTFNSVGKSVLVYNEGVCATTLTVEKTKFNADAAVEGKAAIEIDTSLMPGQTTITVDGETTATRFGTGNVSGNSLWNNKKGNADAANNDITVTVDGKTVLAPVYEAKVTAADGTETNHRTFAEAFEAVAEGQTITLLANLDITELIKIEKAITFDLGGKTVTADCKKAFEVYANATFKNGTIKAQQRCIDTREAIELTLDNVNLVADTYYAAHGNQQPLTIGGAEHGTKVVMNEVEINAGTQGYGIISFVKTEASISHSTISGYSVLYAKTGSEGSVFDFTKSALTATNEGNDVEGNSFSAIALEANDVTVNIDAESTVSAKGEHMWAIYAASAATGNKVTALGSIDGNLLAVENVNANTITVKADYAEALNAAGYSYSTNEDGTITAKKATVMIGNTNYPDFKTAIAAVQDGETITIATGATGSELSEEIEFTKDIKFTITGNAPKYALPVVTFQNAEVTIKDAEILIPELDARQDAVINVVNSTVYDAGGNGIVKSYYNGAINIDATSTVYTMQVTTMGYINVAGTLNATWQTNVYGNGMITLAEGATFNTAGLNLTAQDYSGRDNTDEERVDQPATIIVDGATFTAGKVYSESGADYSYNADKYGLNVGTIDGKSALFDIKNGANVNIYAGNEKTVNFGAGATVNVDASTLNVLCRAENGTATLANNGTVNVSGESNLNIKNVSGNAIAVTDATLKDLQFGGRINAFGTNNISGASAIGGILGLGYGTNPTEQVVVNITGNFNGTNVIISTNNGVDNLLNVGDANGERTTAHFGQLAGFADVNINNADVTYDYAFIRNDLNVTNSALTIKGGVNTYFAGNAKVVIDNSTWSLPGYANIGSYGDYMYGNADVTLKNGSKMTATNLGVEVDGEKVVKLTLEDTSNLTATKLTNQGTIELAGLGATIVANECGNVITNIQDMKIAYAEGTYKVVAKEYVAYIGEQGYESLAEALDAAADGDKVELAWAEGDPAIAMNGAVYGKSVTITGTATVDWSKGWFFVGRGGEGDATVTFDGANLTSASANENSGLGIHVSGREKNTDNKYDGTLVIKNSTIDLDYLVNKGTMSLDNSTLTVKNGFSIGGRPASETENGEDATATMTLNNGSKLVVNNHNGMGLGYEALGVMNVDATSTFETTQAFLVTAKGTMNIAGTVEIAGALTNNGAINFTTTTATLATTTEGLTISHNQGESYKVVYENGVYRLAHYVAYIGDVYYETLEAALEALTDGATLTLLEDITATELWDCRNNGARVTAANVTIDGNGHTLKLTGEVNDANWNTVFRFEGDNATVKNLTIDASEAAGIQRGITAKLSITVDNCTFIGNGTTAKLAVIFGEGTGTALANVEATVTNSTFKNWTLGVSDNQNGQDAKSVTVSGNTFENASVLVSASENVTFVGNELTGAGVNITSYTNMSGLSVSAVENVLDAEQENKITVDPSHIYAQGGFSTPIVKVGEPVKYYVTLGEAIEEANGATVTVLDDIILSEAVVVDGVAAVLNLNGNSITPAADATMTGGLIRLLDNADLTITGEGEISNNGNEKVYAAVGVLGNDAKLTVNGGNLTGYYYGIAGNGYKTGTQVTINGGVIAGSSTDCLGIYHPQNGTLTVTGGEITGATGIYFKGGKLDIQGGTIKGTGAAVDYVYNGSGCEATGDALVIENAAANGYAAIEVSITGGTFISENAAPVASYAPEASDALVEFIGEGCNAQFSNDNIDENLLVIGYQLTMAEGAEFFGVELTNHRESMTIVDGAYTEFVNETELSVGTLTYERTFTNVNTWQALYVPFEIPVEALTELGYEAAYLYDVHNKVVAGEEIDPSVIESIHFVKITKGTLRANYPYIIRPTQGADLNLALILDDVKLHSTAANAMNSVESSTTTTRYIFAGTYTKANRATLTGDDNTPCYAIWPDGIWYQMNATNNLGAFRVFMYIINKDGSPVIVNEEVAQSIKIRIIGEENEDGTTTIYDVEADEQTVDYIYDLQGRRVLEPQKGSLYIVNGKKIVF